MIKHAYYLSTYSMLMPQYIYKVTPTHRLLRSLKHVIEKTNKNCIFLDIFKLEKAVEL